MGSKKLKKRKIKVKKLEKLIKSTKKKERNIFDSSRINTDPRVLNEKSSCDNRLDSEYNIRFSCKETSLSDIICFSKVRENYFEHLQKAISENCDLGRTEMTNDILVNLALQLEQNALLASLQIDIYRRFMCDIIKDIKKSTQENQLYADLKKLLPDFSAEEVDQNTPVSNCSLPDTNNVSPTIYQSENYNTIPIIANVRSDNASSHNWLDPGYHENQYYQESFNNQNENCGWSEDTFSDNTNYWNFEQFKLKSLNNYNNIGDTTAVQSHAECDSLNLNIIALPESVESNDNKPDPLSESRNQLQKFVEQTLNESEKAKKERKEQQERDYITQILEGDNSLDDGLNDSLSDNETESKENIDDSNFTDRLQKIRELFGLNEEENHIETLKGKRKTNQSKQLTARHRRPTIWKHEKYIHLHKYSIVAAEMTLERREHNRKLFLELFGEDSDEDNEEKYSCEEKYRSSCVERISSWVVKYLMPFYHSRRILGRSVFKSLGHYISEAIIDKIQYPDEWTVKYFVSKFFPPKKKYVCDGDIVNFQLD